MTIYQFNSLSEMEQIEIIWKVPAIAERFENGYKIFLFQVDAFYVELYHHVERDATERLRTFSSTDKLMPYLTDINIDELVE
jgi:hypothetical protein